MSPSDRGDDASGRERTRVAERELLLRHREGDAEAFAGLVAEYRAPVYAYLVRCGVDPADRDDLFQEVFIKIHAAASRYRAERPLHPWLFTIVANTVRTFLRKKKVRDLVFASPPRQDPPAPSVSSERRAMARQTVTWLEGEIPRLPLNQREALVLCCVENLPLKVVAEVLDLPINTVKTHLRRARLALIEKLARRDRAGRGEESP